MRMDSENLIAIPDNNSIDRIKLGLLDSSRNLWGFEMYDERGIPFMSTTQKRQWFRGASITGRLLSVPYYSYVFSTGAASDSDFESYASSEYTIPTGTYNDPGWSCFSGENLYFLTRVGVGSVVHFYAHDINTNTNIQSFNLSTLLSATSCYFMQYVGNQKIVFLYTTAVGNAKLGEYDEFTQTFKTLTTLNSNGTPMSLCFTGSDIFVNYSSNGLVERYSYSSGVATYIGNADTGYASSISQITYTGSAILFAVKTTVTYKLFKYTLDLGTTSNGSIADFSNKMLAFDGGDLWMCSAAGGVRSYDPSDLSSQVAMSSVFAASYSVVFDGKNVLVFYIGGTGNHRIKKIDLFSGTAVGDMRVSTSYDKDLVFDGLNIFVFGSSNIMKMPSA
jgi:hypothetical protein